MSTGELSQPARMMFRPPHFDEASPFNRPDAYRGTSCSTGATPPYAPTYHWEPRISPRHTSQSPLFLLPLYPLSHSSKPVLCSFFTFFSLLFYLKALAALLFTHFSINNYNFTNSFFNQKSYKHENAFLQIFSFGRCCRCWYRLSCHYHFSFYA